LALNYFYFNIKINFFFIKPDFETIEEMQVSSDATKYENRNRLIVTDLYKRIILFSFATNSISVFDSVSKSELLNVNTFLECGELVQLSVIPNTDDVLLDEECGFKRYNKYYIDTNLNYFKYEASTSRGFKVADGFIYFVQLNRLVSFDLAKSKEENKFSKFITDLEFPAELENDGILDFEVIASMDYLIVLSEHKCLKLLSLFSIKTSFRKAQVIVDSSGDFNRLLTNGEFVFVNDSWKNKINRYLIIESNNENHENQLALLKSM